MRGTVKEGMGRWVKITGTLYRDRKNAKEKIKCGNDGHTHTLPVTRLSTFPFLSLFALSGCTLTVHKSRAFSHPIRIYLFLTAFLNAVSLSFSQEAAVALVMMPSFNCSLSSVTALGP